MALGVPMQNAPSAPAPNRSGNRQGRAATGARPSGSTAPPAFTPTPEYSNQGAWSGWDQAAPQRTQQLPIGILGETFNALSGGALDLRQTNQAYYEQKYGPQLVQQAMKSGMDPQTFFSLGSGAQQQAVQWGTNLPNAQTIGTQQRGVFDQQQQQRTANNDYIDQFGALQTSMQDNLMGQYNSGAGMAQGRYNLGVDQANQGYATDRALLGERQYRDVDLARNNNAIDMNYNGVMRGVLDERRGIRGDVFSNQQSYLNDQTGFLNQQRNNAFDRFGSNDAYLGQQSKDLMAQYGFAGRQFDQDIQGAFAQRDTQRRGAASDAAARGAFGSAGFGDNIQDIQGQYDRSKDAATLGLDQATQGIDERDRAIGNDRANLRFNYTDTTIGFDRDQRGIEKGHQDNKTGYQDDLATFRGQYAANDRDRGQLQNVNAGLDSLAREYGIKGRDLKNQLDASITKMGLDLNETMGSLEQMLNSGNAQLQAQGMSFMQQMMAFQ